jgi:CRP-like cAMP-binding protein
MGRGDFFGEMALLYRCTRTATITAKSTVQCMSLGRADLQLLLGDNLSPILFQHSVRIAFEKNYTMSQLTLD